MLQSRRRWLVSWILTFCLITVFVNVPVREQCTPHSELMKRYGLPGPCDNRNIILDCVDPTQSYLTDPDVLGSCGVVKSDQKSERGMLRDQVKKKQGHCEKNEDILLSFHSNQYHKNTSSSSKESTLVVPNIVHYVQLGCGRIFSFKFYMSVFSVHRFIQPEKIIFHGDCLPTGPWWKRVLQTVPGIYFRYHPRIVTIQGQSPKWVQHETDVIRLQTLIGEISSSVIFFILPDLLQ